MRSLQPIPAPGPRVDPADIAEEVVQRLRTDDVIASSYEEQMIVCVIRLVGNAIGPGTLSPMERALVAGAKVVFDNLSAQCEEMLNRTAADVVNEPPAESPIMEVDAPSGSQAGETPRKKATGRRSRSNRSEGTS